MAFRLKMTMADGTEATLIQTEHDYKTKMAGIPSFSTCCLMNPACLARMRNGESVCAACFSAAIQKFRKGVKLTTSQNYVTLNRTEIETAPTVKWTPKLLAINPGKLTRVESWGDTASVLQCINYLHLIKANPDCQFGVWTKNLNYWVRALKRKGKPRNMTLVFSSLRVNRPDAIPEWALLYVDHRFTVYTKEWLEAHGMCSNCAGISCATCKRCYKRCRRNSKDFDILEILRGKMRGETA